MRPETLRRVESVLEALREAGFSPADTDNAAYIFSNFVHGLVAEETTPRAGRYPPLGATRLRAGARCRGTRASRLGGWAKRSPSGALDQPAQPGQPNQFGPEFGESG